MDMAHNSKQPFGPQRRRPSQGEALRDQSLAPVTLDERRLHLRARAYWLSLRRGRDCPAIADLDLLSTEFAPHGLLLDLSAATDMPILRNMGQSVREACAFDSSFDRSATGVPPSPLLASLTRHWHRVIARRAPVAVELEIVGRGQRSMLYRALLMPFSSGGGSIDFVYAVISGKERVDTATEMRIAEEIADAEPARPRKGDRSPWPESCGRAATVG